MSESNYRNRNPKSTNDFLEELILQNYGEVLKAAVPDSESGFQKIVSTDIAQNLTPPTLPNDKIVGSATIMVEGKSVRYKENGTPTITDGLALNDGDIIEVSREQLTTMKFISKKAGEPATLQIQYYYSLQLDL